MPGLEELVYTVPQTSAALKVSETQVRRMVKNGTLQTVPGVGRRILISRDWLARWVASGGNPSERPETGTTAAHAGHAEPATGGTGRGDTGLKGDREAARSTIPTNSNAAEAGAHRPSAA